MDEAFSLRTAAVARARSSAPARAGGALACLLLLAAGWLLLPGGFSYAEQPLVIDECGWLAVSHDTFRLFFQEDRAPPEAWRQGLQRTAYGNLNPSFAKLLFGFVLWRMDYDLPPPEVFPVLFPAAKGRMGDGRWLARQAAVHEPFIAALRRVNQGLMAAGAVGVFVAGRLLSGWLLGLLAWGWFLATGTVTLLAPRLATDSLLLLMSTAAAAATAAAATRWCRQRDGTLAVIWVAGALGLLLGATAGTKLNGAVSSLLFGAAVLGLWAAGRFRGQPRLLPLGWLATTALVCCAFFLWQYPYLWSDVPGQAARLFHRWDVLIQDQIQRQFRRAATPGLGAKLAAVWRGAVLETGPLGWLTAAGFFLGAPWAAWKGWRSLRDPGASPAAWVAWLWAAGWLVATALWLPYTRPRYLLPAIGPVCVLAMLPVAEAIRAGLRRAGLLPPNRMGARQAPDDA